MSCACCGEGDLKFLTIDHINNDGAEHRRAVGTHLYRVLIKANFPNGFQVLCFNCNMGKRINGGVCPHGEKAIHVRQLKRDRMRRYRANLKTRSDSTYLSNETKA